MWSRLLEDAQIELSVVAADSFGVSGQTTPAALIAGEPRPEGTRAAGTGKGCAPSWASWPRRSPGTSAPPRLPAADDARPHRRARRPDRAAGPAGSTELLAPFAHQVDTLDELPGIGRITAQELIGRRALVAVGNQVLTIASHLLSDPQARFADLGADFHDRLPPQRRTRQVIRELEHLSGKTVTLHDAA